MATLDIDAESKALHKAADQQKRDLKDGADVRVSDGSDDGRTRVDPFDARKAMFAKADALREAEAAQGGSVQDAALAQAAKDAGIDLEALQRGHAPVGAPAPVTPAPDRTLHLNKDKTPATSSTPGSQNVDERVTLQLNGAEISVSKRDVDRAGGAELYVRRRELDAEADRLARQNAELRQQLEAERKLRQELQQGTSPAGHGTDPANRTADPAVQHRNDAGTTGGDDEKLAERLADLIYSGDQDEAKKGIAELIRVARSRGEVPNTQAIVAQVRAELAGAPKADGNNETPARTSDPIVERVNQAINAMSLADFPDLMKHEVGRAAAYARFKELVKLPENRDRLVIDIARDALEEIEPKFINRRDQIVERKRGLQATSAASGAIRDETEVEQDASAIVKQMASARSFGPRPQQ